MCSRSSAGRESRGGGVVAVGLGSGAMLACSGGGLWNARI